MTTKTKSKFNKQDRVNFGSEGGKALAKKVGKKGMKKLGEAGSKARWERHDKCRPGRPCRHNRKKA